MGDLVMMQCDALALRLSTAGCGRRYSKAQGYTPSAWEPENPCKYCPIGAANAGVVFEPMAEAVNSLRHICPRCEKAAPRLIRGHHCISCYNRDREAASGRNAKGTRPALADSLHAVALAVVEADRASVKIAPRVASRVEAMIAMAKAAVAPLAFASPLLDWELPA